jgi:hypothetical protein
LYGSLPLLLWAISRVSLRTLLMWAGVRGQICSRKAAIVGPRGENFCRGARLCTHRPCRDTARRVRHLLIGLVPSIRLRGRARVGVLYRRPHAQNVDSKSQLRESQQRIILSLNSAIKQKDELATRLFAEARLGFQWDCRTRAGVRRLRPIIPQIGSKTPKFLKTRGVSLRHEGGALFI